MKKIIAALLILNAAVCMSNGIHCMAESNEANGDSPIYPEIVMNNEFETETATGGALDIDETEEVEENAIVEVRIPKNIRLNDGHAEYTISVHSKDERVTEVFVEVEPEIYMINTTGDCVVAYVTKNKSYWESEELSGWIPSIVEISMTQEIKESLQVVWITT